MSGAVDRRTVLAGLGAGGAAVVVGGGLLGLRLLDDDAAAPAPTTIAPGPDPVTPLRAALAAVGTRYLEAEPQEADRDLLLAALPALGGSVPAQPRQGLAVLAPQAAEDHRTGDVIELDGWVLSRTECRAAALYAL